MKKFQIKKTVVFEYEIEAPSQNIALEIADQMELDPFDISSMESETTVVGGKLTPKEVEDYIVNVYTKYMPYIHLSSIEYIGPREYKMIFGMFGVEGFIEVHFSMIEEIALIFDASSDLTHEVLELVMREVNSIW